MKIMFFFKSCLYLLAVVFNIWFLFCVTGCGLERHFIQIAGQTEPVTHNLIFSLCD